MTTTDQLVDRVNRGLSDFPELARVFGPRWVSGQLFDSPLHACHPIVRWASWPDADRRARLLDGLERAVADLREADVEGLPGVLCSLRHDTESFPSILGEIRLGAHFLRQQMLLSLQPLLPDSPKRSDLLIHFTDLGDAYVEVYGRRLTEGSWELWEQLECARREYALRNRKEVNFLLRLVCGEIMSVCGNVMEHVVDETLAWLAAGPHAVEKAEVVSEPAPDVRVIAEPCPCGPLARLHGPRGYGPSGVGNAKPYIEQAARNKLAGGQLPKSAVCVLALDFQHLPRLGQECLDPDECAYRALETTDWDLPSELDFVLLFLFELPCNEPWGMQKFINPSSPLVGPGAQKQP